LAAIWDGSTVRVYRDGLIDEVRIYSHALSQAEVQATMVPEPSSFGLLCAGAIGLLAFIASGSGPSSSRT
jgi:hypothetical protein